VSPPVIRSSRRGRPELFRVVNEAYDIMRSYMRAGRNGTGTGTPRTSPPGVDLHPPPMNEGGMALIRESVPERRIGDRTLSSTTGADPLPQPCSRRLHGRCSSDPPWASIARNWG